MPPSPPPERAVSWRRDLVAILLHTHTAEQLHNNAIARFHRYDWLDTAAKRLEFYIRHGEAVHDAICHYYDQHHEYPDTVTDDLGDFSNHIEALLAFAINYAQNYIIERRLWEEDDIDDQFV